MIKYAPVKIHVMKLTDGRFVLHARLFTTWDEVEHYVNKVVTRPEIIVLAADARTEMTHA